MLDPTNQKADKVEDGVLANGSAHSTFRVVQQTSIMSQLHKCLSSLIHLSQTTYIPTSEWLSGNFFRPMKSTRVQPIVQPTFQYLSRSAVIEILQSPSTNTTLLRVGLLRPDNAIFPRERSSESDITIFFFKKNEHIRC